MAHDVFVSYSSKDKAVADTIVASLEKNKIRCWYAPRDIEPGNDWGEAITNAIEASRVFLIVFSGNANRSQRVLDEVNFAISEEIPILPFRIENLAPFGAMKLHLSSRHWLDAYDPSWEAHIKKLVKNVAGILETNIEEEKIELPQQITKTQQHSNKKKLGWIIFSMAAVLILGIAGWFALPVLFPESRENATTEIPAVTQATTQAVAAQSQSATSTSDLEVVDEKLERNAVLDLAFSAVDELNFAPVRSNTPEETTLMENLFLNLTNIDHDTLQIVPEAAESWSISVDGKLYTFKLREDIPWVIHTLNGETEQVLDENGEPRFLTAQDYEYAIRRICNPNIDLYDFQLRSLIKGCSEVFEYENPDNIPDELIEAIGVKAVSDSELIVELNQSSGFFLSITTTHAFLPLPSWAMEKYGNAWTNPGLIHTNGYYVIDELILGETLTLIRNPFLPEDLGGDGNIGKINISLGHTLTNAYDKWKSSTIDITEIPDESFLNHQQDFPENIFSQPQSGIHYINLNPAKPPFDNIHVRRAFSAALDKELFINALWGESYRPVDNLVIPGLIGAPDEPFDSLGYDPDLAKTELADAGYPQCEGLPEINLHNFFSAPLPEKNLRNWEAALGCPENTIIINDEFVGPENTDMILIGWGIDYPDQVNMYDFIDCNNTPLIGFIRECSEIDALIHQAKQEITLTERAQLIRDLEEALFSNSGEFPVIPLAAKYFNYAVQDWLTLEHNPFGKSPFYDWIIDMEAKQN